VPKDLSTGDQKELPIEPGFGKRRDLWCISAHLAVITIEDTIFLKKSPMLCGNIYNLSVIIEIS